MHKNIVTRVTIGRLHKVVMNVHHGVGWKTSSLLPVFQEKYAPQKAIRWLWGRANSEVSQELITLVHSMVGRKAVLVTSPKHTLCSLPSV